MKIAIFGSSGHGSDVADIAIDNGYTDIIFLTKDIDINEYCGFPVLLDAVENIKNLISEQYCFAIGVGAPNIRKLIAERYSDLTYPTLIHSTASIGNCLSPNLENTRGTILAAGSRITNNVTIGDFCFMGVNTVIGHDCIVENYVSLMPGAAVSGNVHICNAAYIGCNASIKHGTPDQKIILGQNSIVGMGAVVLNDVPEDHNAIGVPAVNLPK